VTQILAIYPKNEVEIFNTVDFSTTFVTPESIFEHIEYETRCIVIKDQKQVRKILEKIRKGFIALDVIIVDAELPTEIIDNRTHLVSSQQLSEKLESLFALNMHFFNDLQLEQEITTLQKLSINVLLWTEKGFYGELAAEYLANGDQLFSFDLQEKDENHLISELSRIMEQNKQKFITFYINNFESIITLISVIEWFSANKTYLSRAVFHLEDDQWLSDLPENIFKTHYTLKVPPLNQRLRDLFALINTYDYNYLTKEFVERIMAARMSEKELIALLNDNYNKEIGTFMLPDNKS